MKGNEMSKNTTTTTTSGGIGFFGLLSIVLVTLKLLDQIEISWFWALFPITIPLAIVGIIMLIAGIAAVYDKIR